MFLLKQTLPLILLFSLFGCTPLPVISCVTPEYAPGFAAGGKIAVVAADEDAPGSEAFLRYKKAIEAKLAMIGYEVVTPEEATYVALVSYAIVEHGTGTTYMPTYGMTSIGGWGGGSAFSMPNLSTPGISSQTHKHYLRTLDMTIVTVAGYHSGERKPVYEARVKSTGNCGQFDLVFDEMLKAMFMSFTGPSGHCQRVEIPFNKKCPM